jgi:hypothetical protein
MISNLKKYINVKRLNVAGKTAAGVRNAGGSNKEAAAAAAAAASAPSSSTPLNVGNRAAVAAAQNGANATTQAAAAAAAAAATGASGLLQQAGNPNVTIGTIQVNGANRRYNVRTGQFVNQSVPPYYSVKRDFFRRKYVAVNANKFRNWASNKSISTLQQLPNNVKRQIRNFQTIINNKRTALQTQGNSLVASLQSRQEKIIKAPNGRNITVVRANNKSQWNFKNKKNASNYNLNNRNKNTPSIRNVNIGNSHPISDNNKYANSKRTNVTRQLRTSDLAQKIVSNPDAPYIAEALARLNKWPSVWFTSNNKEKLRDSLLKAGVKNIPQI